MMLTPPEPGATSPRLGTYVRLADPGVVDVVAACKFDFVRFDVLHADFGAAIDGLIDRANERGLAVWIRAAAETAASFIDPRVSVVTVPDIESAGQLDRLWTDFAEGPTRLGCQAESVAALRALEEILSTPALSGGGGVLHAGRNDLMADLGVDSQFHGDVLMMEDRVLGEAIERGVQTSLHVPITERGLAHARSWASRGVTYITLDIDRRVLDRAWSEAVRSLVGA